MAVLFVASTFYLSHRLSLTSSSPVVSYVVHSLTLHGRCFPCMCGCKSRCHSVKNLPVRLTICQLVSHSVFSCKVNVSAIM